jgi:hypothetical protein
MQRALLEEASRKVTIVADGEQTEVSIEQVVARKLLQVAAGGSPHALSNVINEMVLAQHLKQTEIDADVSFGYRFKALQQEKFNQALEAGLDPDTVLPHPDDILVVEGEGYRLTGPHDEFSLNLIKANCARRDLFILQHVLEDRLRPAQYTGSRAEGEGGADGRADSSALLLVYFMNHGLPERFRMSDADILLAIMRHRCKTKRELLKEAHRAWAATGRPKPRGWTLPPFPVMRAMLEQTIPAFLDLYKQVASGKVVGEYAIAGRIQEIALRQAV